MFFDCLKMSAKFVRFQIMRKKWENSLFICHDFQILNPKTVEQKNSGYGLNPKIGPDYSQEYSFFLLFAKKTFDNSFNDNGGIFFLKKYSEKMSLRAPAHICNVEKYKLIN